MTLSHWSDEEAAGNLGGCPDITFLPWRAMQYKAGGTSQVVTVVHGRSCALL